MDETLNIVVVDDEAIVCTRLKPALEKNGYHVETFTSSTLARQYLEEHAADIVITDVKMADLDGMQLFAFIRDTRPQTRVIIISGFATVELTREAFQAGACDVITKPFKISQLKDLVGRVAAEIHGAGESADDRGGG
jgi:DNA-binding NtrC family response regulator